MRLFFADTAWASPHPGMLIVLERNLDFSAGQQPAIFPIQDIHDKLGIDLLQNSYTFQPSFVSSFIGILKKVIRQLPDNSTV